MIHIDRREFLKGVGVAAVAAVLPRSVWAADPAPRCNIVLCMTDDQGWGDVSYNGLTKIKTPVLDDMAANALRFDRFYAAAPVCSPTRGSVMTGRHPFRYGCFSYGFPIRIKEVTVAQVLHDAGYVTGHFGKWHLNGVSGPGKPIDGNDPLSPGKLGFDEWLSVSNFFDLDCTFSRKGALETFKGDGSDVIVGEALKFIDQVLEQKKPFLAVVWFGSPHDPHNPLPEDKRAAGGSAYYGELVGVDRAMGALRAGLRKRGIADNTLVWFNSDNGPTGPGSTGGLRGSKGTVWEGGLRVPGIIEWPARIKKPMVTAVPAFTSDIYPTLLEITGAKPARQVEPLDGISLVPLLDGKMTERTKPMGFWYKTVWGNMDKDTGHAALTDNRYKLHKLGPDKYELYDLLADAREKNDLAAEKTDVVGQMKKTLNEWQDSVARSYRGEDYREAK